MTQSSASRIAYLDQLKGLAIIAVVFGHLMLFSLGIEHSTLLKIASTFDLPLFFFISGFLLHNPNKPPKSILAQIWKKFHCYLIPSFSVGAVYCFFFHRDFMKMIFNQGGGYLWFLQALFLISTICILLSVISRKIQPWFTDKRIQFLADIVVYLTPYLLIIALHLYWNSSPEWLHIAAMATYYRWFALGIIVRKYVIIDSFISDSHLLYAFGVCLFILGIVYSDLNNRILILLSQFSGIVVLWVFFKNSQRDSFVLRTLQKCGEHSLGIYLFHYFLLFDMSHFGAYISEGNSFIIHILICGLASCIIIPICILVELFLEKSIFLRFLLASWIIPCHKYQGFSHLFLHGFMEEDDVELHQTFL